MSYGTHMPAWPMSNLSWSIVTRRPGRRSGRLRHKGARRISLVGADGQTRRPDRQEQEYPEREGR